MTVRALHNAFEESIDREVLLRLAAALEVQLPCTFEDLATAAENLRYQNRTLRGLPEHGFVPASLRVTQRNGRA